ncbi:hypothetical protein C8F04DRAFT_1203527 [Mycena alexandri]|uniref:Uncharacterized protein n=1 Tax=Mycena alexandri TaxID=1745969 RepID=A0AAD6WK06_9AGAR|nr:hypothetical protein C8F04DRAFT_1203527 [Mycena alexandri]
MERGFFKSWPEANTLGIEDPAVDDGTAEAAPGMSIEDAKRLGLATKKRKKNLTRFLGQQLHSWFNNQIQKAKRQLEDPGGGKQGHLAVHLFKSLGKKKRNLQEIEIFQKRHRAEINAAVKATRLQIANNTGSSDDTSSSSDSNSDDSSSSSSSEEDVNSSGSDSGDGGEGGSGEPKKGGWFKRKAKASQQERGGRSRKGMWENASEEEKAAMRRVYLEQDIHASASEESLEQSSEERSPAEIQGDMSGALDSGSGAGMAPNWLDEDSHIDPALFLDTEAPPLSLTQTPPAPAPEFHVTPQQIDVSPIMQAFGSAMPDDIVTAETYKGLDANVSSFRYLPSSAAKSSASTSLSLQPGVSNAAGSSLLSRIFGTSATLVPHPRPRPAYGFLAPSPLRSSTTTPSPAAASPLHGCPAATLPLHAAGSPLRLPTMKAVITHPAYRLSAPSPLCSSTTPSPTAASPLRGCPDTASPFHLADSPLRPPTTTAAITANPAAPALLHPAAHSSLHHWSNVAESGSQTGGEASGTGDYHRLPESYPESQPICNVHLPAKPPVGSSASGSGSGARGGGGGGGHGGRGSVGRVGRGGRGWGKGVRKTGSSEGYSFMQTYDDAGNVVPLALDTLVSVLTPTESARIRKVNQVGLLEVPVELPEGSKHVKKLPASREIPVPLSYKSRVVPGVADVKSAQEDAALLARLKGPREIKGGSMTRTPCLLRRGGK